MEKTILRMENISKSFGNNKVLQDVSLELCQGEVIALLGENGAGKSTLMKILGGIYSADSGAIYIHEEKKQIDNPITAGENGIRIIHQEIVLVPERSVASNIFLGREYRTKLGFIDYRRMLKETEEMLQEYGLPIKADEKIGNLSIGLQQFVEIIKAVSADSKIVVMDEPTSSLSKAESDKLFGIIQQLQKKGIGIIYISHRLEELFEISSRIIVLRDGFIVGNVPTAEVDKDTLIRLMVGRSLSSYYSHHEHPTANIALEVKNLSSKGLFSNVSFYTKYGEILGFSGLVGAGRTELMKTIFGMYKRNSGSILLDGEEVSIHCAHDAIRRKIAYVSEDRKTEGLIMTNTVRFNIGIVCLNELIQGITINTKKWSALVEHYKQLFSIKITSPEQIVFNLSGGNQQKIVLSKWLAKQPKVLILDEPTKGVDVASKAEIYRIIDQLAQQGTSVVLVSSELSEIINMCDRCYVMCEGRIRGELNREEFTQEKIMLYATDTGSGYAEGERS